DLEETQITELPEGLNVGGSLYLRGTQITELPEGLNVGDSLYLCGTQITELPEGLNVGDSLYLEETQITELPESFSCESLYLNPENFKEIESKSNCGAHSRTIFVLINKGEFYVAAGCFFDTFTNFCEAVNGKYSDHSAKKYIADAQECIEKLTANLASVA
ncbi:MAG: hypothetical protein COB03_18660, partial [Alteromonas sp.]